MDICLCSSDSPCAIGRGQASVTHQKNTPDAPTKFSKVTVWGAMTKRFFIAIAVYALSMILVIAVVVRLYAIAANQDIQKNPVDLRTAKFFSRPITELEMILLNLKAQAKESASFVAETAELHIIKTIGIAPEGDAGLEGLGRPLPDLPGGGGVADGRVEVTEKVGDGASADFLAAARAVGYPPRDE